MKNYALTVVMTMFISVLTWSQNQGEVNLFLVQEPSEVTNNQENVLQNLIAYVGGFQPGEVFSFHATVMYNGAEIVNVTKTIEEILADPSIEYTGNSVFLPIGSHTYIEYYTCSVDLLNAAGEVIQSVQEVSSE